MNSILALNMPGFGEMLPIVFFVLIFFGAKKLPELARSVGLSIQEFKKAKDEFHRELVSTPEEVATRDAKDKETAAKPS